MQIAFVRFSYNNSVPVNDAKMKQSKNIIRYELPAETPRTFHAMPNQAHAMYVPEIRANSNEARFTVTDKNLD